MAALRSRGIRVIIYLDDMLFLNEEREGLVADVKMARIYFKGWVFSSTGRNLSLPPLSHWNFWE
jgi:hypothetical protein